MIDGPTPLARIGLHHDGDTPYLRGWTHDGRQISYALSPAEVAALVKRLSGYLAMLHRQPDGLIDDWPTHDTEDDDR